MKWIHKHCLLQHAWPLQWRDQWEIFNKCRSRHWKLITSDYLLDNLEKCRIFSHNVNWVTIHIFKKSMFPIKTNNIQDTIAPWQMSQVKTGRGVDYLGELCLMCGYRCIYEKFYIKLGVRIIIRILKNYNPSWRIITIWLLFQVHPVTFFLLNCDNSW